MTHIYGHDKELEIIAKVLNLNLLTFLDFCDPSDSPGVKSKIRYDLKLSYPR